MNKVSIVYYRDDKISLQDTAFIPLGKARRMDVGSKHYSLLTDAMKEAAPQVIMRISKGDGVFYSKDYQLAKTKNSYTVLYLDQNNVKKYGLVLSYVDVTDALYAVVLECRTDVFSLDENMKGAVQDENLLPYIGKLCPHIVKLSSYGEKILVPVRNVLKKCVFMEIKEDLIFISRSPNYVEHG